METEFSPPSPEADLEIRGSFERSKSSNRMLYEAQVQAIQQQIGGLEEVRQKLGLSQRKICQLLMVDPSAWNRWTATTENSAPPHVWRSLQWYFALKKEIPGLSENYFLGHERPVRDREIQASKLKHQASQMNEVVLRIGLLQSELSFLKKENEVLTLEFQRYQNSFHQATTQKKKYQIVAFSLGIVLIAATIWVLN